MIKRINQGPVYARGLFFGKLTVISLTLPALFIDAYRKRSDALGFETLKRGRLRVAARKRVARGIIIASDTEDTPFMVLSNAQRTVLVCDRALQEDQLAVET